MATAPGPAALARGASAGASAPAAAAPGRAGVQGTVTGVTVTAQQLRNRPEPARGAPRQPGPHHTFGGRTTPVPSAGSGSTAARPTAAAVAPGEKLPQTFGDEILGPAVTDTVGYVPPDTMGAVGPTQFLFSVNGRFRAFNKNAPHTQVMDADQATFWGSTADASGVSDAHVRYDRTSQRWFITEIDVPTGNNHILLAVSSSADLSTASWTLFRVPTTGGSSATDSGCFTDYDTPGIDSNAIYIGGIMFSGVAPCNTGDYKHSNLYVLQKSSALTLSLHYTAFYSLVTGIFGVSTIQGVDSVDATSTGYAVAVNETESPRTHLSLWQVNNPSTTTPSVSSPVNVTIAAENGALGGVLSHNNVVSADPSRPMDDVDDRLFAAVIRNGHLWTAHNLGVDSTGDANGGTPTREAMRWYDVTVATDTVNQSGTVFDAASSGFLGYWMGTVMVSGQGHVAMGLNRANSATNVQAGAMGRLSGDASGTMGAFSLFQASTGDAYDDIAANSNPANRWGDFTYTSLDPCDDMTMWTTQEYVTGSADSGIDWRIAAQRLLAPAPATPTAPNPVLVPSGHASVTVPVTGSSSGGTGFYDTPSSNADPCRTRLQASVTGGVVVNSVTYVDATHVTLDISTAAATAGLQDLTVTNPDGQAVTTTGFLDVEPLPTTQSASSTQKYKLHDSDGTAWQEIDPARLRITTTPAGSQSVLLTGNADLWTANAGYNQDIGIFVSDNGAADQLLAWKESGGFAGTFSPNAAYVQWRYDMTGGHTYLFKLKWKTNRAALGATIFAGAGTVPGNYSPTSLVAETFPAGVTPGFASSNQQYTQASPSGSGWVPMDTVNLSTTLTPTSDSTALLGGNVDLWTANPGVNQDIGIFVSDNGAAFTLVAWKESGGFAGTFSPNAAFVSATYPMTATHVYEFRLEWKANRNAPGASIYAAAGPGPAPYSPTTLLAETIAAGVNPFSLLSTSQYTLPNSNGSTWQLLDPALNVAVTAPTDGNAILGANVDLFTNAAGYNQDIGIFVSDNGGADTLLAWKESGGFAGTFSPNAAFAQFMYPLTQGHAYVFKLEWKTNKNAPGATIFAAAGPGPAPYSPTRLTVALSD